MAQRDAIPRVAMPTRSTEGWRERLRERAFELRLAASVVAMLVAVGAVGYLLTSRTLERQVVSDAVEVANGQAEAIGNAYLAHGNEQEAAKTAQAMLDGILRGPGVVSAHLFDTDRTILVGGTRRAAGTSGDATSDTNAAGGAHMADREPFEQARVGGEPVVRADGDHAAFEFWVPIDLAGGRHVFHIGLNRTSIDAQLAGLKRQTAATTLAGSAIAIVLFYLLGGRALTARHRKALENSARDPLTSLGNHRAFQEELVRATSRSGRSGEGMACAILDIDSFKQVNDRLGHRQGDMVLRRVAQQLGDLRDGDTAFRIGGDEFAVIMERTDADVAHRVIDRIRVRLASQRSHVTVSAGIADSCAGTVDQEGILERADAALYEAKRIGRNAVVVFAEEMWDTRPVRPEEEQRLQSLLTVGDIGVAFQPIWDLDEAQLIGYEALARPLPESGFDGPAPAFAVATALGRVHELDTLCRRVILARRKQLSLDGILFLNIAPMSIAHASLSAEALFAEVRRAGIAPDRVVIEVTERGVVDVAALADKLCQLRAHGFKVALDDVGAGNAGLELLRRVRADYLKIDREVIVEAATTETSRGVLLAILAFAREAGAYVIAEGIENERLLEFVSRFHSEQTEHVLTIHGVQGFLVGRPTVQPVDEHPTTMVRAFRSAGRGRRSRAVAAKPAVV